MLKGVDYFSVATCKVKEGASEIFVEGRSEFFVVIPLGILIYEPGPPP